MAKQLNREGLTVIKDEYIIAMINTPTYFMFNFIRHKHVFELYQFFRVLKRVPEAKLKKSLITFKPLNHTALLKPYHNDSNLASLMFHTFSRCWKSREKNFGIKIILFLKPVFIKKN